MKSKHISILTYMAAGHVYTSLDVCSELVRRGHRVTFPANEIFAPKIRDAGVEAIELRSPNFGVPKRLAQREVHDDSYAWLHLGSIAGPWHILNSLHVMRELEDFYETNPPDIFLYEWFNFAGRIFAKALQRPIIQMSTHFAHHRSLVRLNGSYITPQPILEFAPVLDNFMSIFGFEGKDQIWHAEALNIFLIPREFQYDADSFDDRYKFVGTTFDGRDNISSFRNATDLRKPVLLISEGSTSCDDRFLRLCVEAFFESRYQVVFLAGVHNTEASSVALPHNFQVHRGVTNREILPFADTVVCQAGMGTTLECLYHGVPVVAVPPIQFNSDVAFRIAELGIGSHVSMESVTPLALKNAVDMTSMDDGIRVRVQFMQNILRSSRGATLAADLIEDFLE